MVDDNGNIIDLDGRIVFPKSTLGDNGDFPKIFPFTKFNPEKVTGDFGRDPNGQPILKTVKGPDGKPEL